MKYNWFETASPFAKLILALAFIFMCGIVGTALAMIIAVPFFHMSLSKIFVSAADFQNSANLPLLQYLQVMQSITIFLVPSFLLANLFNHKPADYLSLRKRPALWISIIAICLVVIIVPLINFLQELNSRMQLPEFLKGIQAWMKSNEENAAVISENFLKVGTIGGLLFNLFMMAILPALGEEFLFRGIFQRLFIELFKNYHWGIIFSAALFSAIHFQFYGFVPRMLLGVIFGYMLVWSGTIWIPVIAHFINNAMGILFFFLNKKGIVDNSLDTIGTNKQDLQTSLISLTLTAILLLLFYELCKRQSDRKTVN